MSARYPQSQYRRHILLYNLPDSDDLPPSDIPEDIETDVELIYVETNPFLTYDDEANSNV